MKRVKPIIALLLCCVLTFGTLSACSGKAKPEISLFIWSEYMPQEILDEFEAEHGIKVNITTFGSIADMYAKVKSAPSGTYDIIDAASFYIKRLTDEGLIE
jgi:spermidine/putrescine-binding protein